MLRSVICLILIISIAAASGWHAFAQPQTAANEAALAAQDPLRAFMQRKLEHSQALLRGLAIEDFDLVASSAQALSLLSLESNWNTINTEEYLDQSADFRRAVKAIREGAAKKNIDRAALGYVQLTIRCVECHKYLRSNKL